MKANAVGGSIIPRSILCLNIGVLLLLNLGTSPTLSQKQQEDETLPPEASETVSPTETPRTIDTETATLTLSAFTDIPVAITPSYLPTQPAMTDVLISNKSLHGEFVSGNVLIRFRKKATREAITKCVQSVNASITSRIDKLNTLVLSVPAEKTADSIFHLKSCPDLRYVEPNYVMHIADIFPTDPGWGNQYGLTNIRAPQGWEMDTGSSSVTIAIVDTGIDLTHPDLAGKLVSGIDIVNDDKLPQDDHGHGTHVAGIAAATSNNGMGVAGVSWGARLMPVKVLNASGSGTYADVSGGIIWAADHGAQIINLSVGGERESQILRDAVDYAISHGVIVIAASGNRGNDFVFYPARYPNVIAVGATDSSNMHATISNYGPEVDLSAPGVSIYSTTPGGYGYRTGTSMSAPFVSGLAAVLLGIPGNGSPTVVTQQMESTALDLGTAGWDDFYGYGLIQMDAALQLVLGNIVPVSPSPVLQISVPDSPDRFIQLPTFTPPATVTPLPTLTETIPAFPIVIFTDTLTPTGTNAPEVIVLETGTPNGGTSRVDAVNWFMPCCGGSLILLGILLFWSVNREWRSNRKRLIPYR